MNQSGLCMSALQMTTNTFITISSSSSSIWSLNVEMSGENKYFKNCNSIETRLFFYNWLLGGIALCSFSQNDVCITRPVNQYSIKYWFLIHALICQDNADKKNSAVLL